MSGRVTVDRPTESDLAAALTAAEAIFRALSYINNGCLDATVPDANDRRDVRDGLTMAGIILREGIGERY